MASFPTGSVRSIFLRLWVRAPRMTRSADSAGGATVASVSDISAFCVVQAFRYARQGRREVLHYMCGFVLLVKPFIVAHENFSRGRDPFPTRRRQNVYR